VGLQAQIRIADQFSIFLAIEWIGDFRRFISISLTATDGFLRNLAKWLMLPRSWIHNILAEIRQTSRPGLIWQSGFESRITFGWNFAVGRGLLGLFSFHGGRTLDTSVDGHDVRRATVVIGPWCSDQPLWLRTILPSDWHVRWRQRYDVYILDQRQPSNFNRISAADHQLWKNWI